MRVRIDKGMTRREVARHMSLNPATISRWELEQKVPANSQIPRIVEFLGYVPDMYEGMPQLTNPLFLYRVKMGMSQEELAQDIGLDTTTIQAIEGGKRELFFSTRSILDDYLLKRSCE